MPTSGPSPNEKSCRPHLPTLPSGEPIQSRRPVSRAELMRSLRYNLCQQRRQLGAFAGEITAIN